MKYVVFVPADEKTAALAECLAYIEREHPEWQSAGVVVGKWPAVWAMVRRGLAEVILIAKRSHLPKDMLPRVVSVEEEFASREVADRPAQRRPKPMA